MWIDEFEFTTHLKLEECYAKLTLALDNNDKKRAYTIKEVLWDGKDVYFRIEMKRSYGRYRGEGELIGKLSRNQTDGKVRAYCYVGDPASLSMSSFSLLSWLFFFFTVFYGRVEGIAIFIGIFLSAIPGVLLMWSDKNLSEEVRGELKYYSREFFEKSPPVQRYPFRL